MRWKVSTELSHLLIHDHIVISLVILVDNEEEALIGGGDQADSLGGSGGNLTDAVLCEGHRLEEVTGMIHHICYCYILLLMILNWPKTIIINFKWAD